MRRKKRNSEAQEPGERRVDGSGWSWLGVLTAVTLPAIFIAPEAKENFRLPKLLLSESLGLATLWLLAWRLRAVRIDLRSVARQPTVLAALPLLAVATLGLATSENPLHVRQALISLWVGLACFVGWSLALSEVEKRRILTAFTLPAAVLAWIAIAQYHGLFEPFQFQGEYKDRIVLTSLAGGAFDLGAYLVLPLLVVQVELVRDRRRVRRWLWVLLLLPMLYAAVLSQTLTVFAALAVASAVLWLVLLPWRRTVAAAAGVAVAGAVLVLAAGPLRERWVRKAEGLFSGDVNQVLTGRLDGWRAAWWMFRRDPLTGVGHGAYGAEFGTARLALADQGVEFYRRQHQPYFSNAHSEPLEVLAEWGLVGFLAAAWAVGMLGRQVLRSRRDPEAGSIEGRCRRALTWAGLAAITVLSLTNFPLRIALVAYPYLVFFSWIVGPPVRGSDGGRRSVDGRWLAAGLLVALSIAFYFHGRQAVRRWEASHQLAEVERRTVALQQGNLLDLRPMPVEVRKTLEGYVDVLRHAATLDPVEVGIPIARGSIYYFLERPQAAIRAYEEALELEARSETYANLGRAYLMAEDRDAATEAFRKALRLNRNIVERYRPYLRGLGLIGRRRGAARPGA